MLFMLFVSLPAMSQEVTIKAGFDSTSILIGDHVNFTITVEQPADINVSIPLFKDTLNNHLEILSGPRKDTSVIPGNRLRIIDSYLVTSFDSGHHRLNPVYAEIDDNNGIKRFYSDYSVLEVNRVRISPPDTATKIFDIIAPYRVPLTLGEIFPWLLVVLLLAAIAWMIKRLIDLNRKSIGTRSAPEVIEPAHLIAFRELEKLKNDQLWQKGETKKYYTRLTEILREYIENRYSIFSMEMTTSETLEALVRTGFRKDEYYKALRSVLTSADLVKFAKYRPLPEENETCFTESWNFILGTKAEEPVGTILSELDRKEGGIHE